MFFGPRPKPGLAWPGRAGPGRARPGPPGPPKPGLNQRLLVLVSGAQQGFLGLNQRLLGPVSGAQPVRTLRTGPALEPYMGLESLLDLMIDKVKNFTEVPLLEKGVLTEQFLLTVKESAKMIY